MMIISVSSGTVYVQSGSDITDCGMKCPDDEDAVELYRECRGEERTLLENLCYINTTKSHDSRLRLHTGSGCWKLTHVRKDDSCVYKIWCYCATRHLISSTEIRVLDPVLISNITSNCSQLGEEVTVIVQFSGEESAVTWEVDGEPLPERYRLIDDNRTLIIPSVQRDDAERRFRVRITNPVSEEIREYQLEIGDPVLVSNITSNCSRLGEEMTVSIQFSGEESAVTWEVDGEPLPERYRLIDDNRTLIIPSVQRDDAERRFRVRITNPVSEKIREYRLINDTMFIRMLETEGSDSYGRTRMSLIAPVLVLVVVVCIIRWILSRGRGNSKVIWNYLANGLLAAVTQNGSDHIKGDSGTGRDRGDPNAQ